jgi:hypothetical protein
MTRRQFTKILGTALLFGVGTARVSFAQEHASEPAASEVAVYRHPTRTPQSGEVEWKIKAESVSRARAKPQIEILTEPLRKEGGTSELDATSSRQFQLKRLRMGWIRRSFLARAVLDRTLMGCLMAFLLLLEYKSSAQWMPPDAQSGAGLARLTGLAGELNCALRGRE